MGAFWTSLLMLGLAVPVLLLAGSAVLVWWLARRITVLQPGRPPWQFVLLHVAIVIGAQLVLLPLVLVGGAVGLAASKLGAVAAFATMAILPYRLYARLRGLARSAAPLYEPAPGSIPPAASPRPSRPWALGSLLGLTGVLLPWVVGVGVKVYLDAQGRPTLPYSDFLNLSTLPVLLVLTVASWAFPFLLLAVIVLVPLKLGTGDLSRPRRLPVWLAYAAGVATAIPVFTGVFWEFDAIYMITPLGVLLLVPMALAYLVGWLVVRRQGAGTPGAGKAGVMA